MVKIQISADVTATLSERKAQQYAKAQAATVRVSGYAVGMDQWGRDEWDWYDEIWEEAFQAWDEFQYGD